MERTRGRVSCGWRGGRRVTWAPLFDAGSGYRDPCEAPAFRKVLARCRLAAPNRNYLVKRLRGVPFEEAWAGREAGSTGTTPVEFIGVEELVGHLFARGRPSGVTHAIEVWKRNPR